MTNGSFANHGPNERRFLRIGKTSGKTNLARSKTLRLVCNTLHFTKSCAKGEFSGTAACAIVKDMQRKGPRTRAVFAAALGTLLAVAAPLCPCAARGSRIANVPNAQNPRLRTSGSSGAPASDSDGAAAQHPAKSKVREQPKKKKETPTGAPLCESKNVTVELPREFLQLVVLNNSFIAKNNSIGVITFQNFFPQAIEEIAIVAEYQDANGKLIYPSVFAASATQVTSPSWFATYLPSQYEIANWPKPVTTRTPFTLGATSAITTAECPAQITVTLLHIRFNDGHEMNYSAPGWQLPTQPEQIPGDLELFVPSADLPEEFLVKVHVPAPLGPIIPPPDVELVDGRASLTFDRIRDQIQEWRFWFAMRNGASVDGDEMLLIRLHSPKEKFGPQTFWIAHDDVPQPLGVIDLVPQRIPGQWRVYYGGVNLSANDVPQMQ